MKVIDLLNKIANGEKTPNIIKFNNMIFKTNGKEYNYYCVEEDKLLEESFILEDLNDEVEIIEDTPKEDNKIEKLDLSDWWEITSAEDCKPEMLAKIFNKNAKAFSSKINEIIDKMNGEENE